MLVAVFAPSPSRSRIYPTSAGRTHEQTSRGCLQQRLGFPPAASKALVVAATGIYGKDSWSDCFGVLQINHEAAGCRTGEDRQYAQVPK
jgi:hypothetical protein